MKRIFDIGFSALLIMVLVPVMFIVALLIYIMHGNPVIFTQERAGLNGKTFKIYKFRTMSNAKDEIGKLLPDEQRLTPLGNILRKLSIDELPQLLNVIRGEMSLVGPRPLLVDYLPLYSEEQSRRHNVKPGITGWAQINGRNEISWKRKFELDVWYVTNYSFWLDLKILYFTIVAVFWAKGVYARDKAPTEHFTGDRL